MRPLVETGVRANTHSAGVLHHYHYLQIKSTAHPEVVACRQKADAGDQQLWGARKGEKKNSINKKKKKGEIGIYKNKGKKKKFINKKKKEKMKKVLIKIKAKKNNKKK